MAIQDGIKYLYADVVGLYQAYHSYRDMIFNEQGIDILQNLKCTTSSLAEAIFFRNYYNPKIDKLFDLGDYYNSYCKDGFKGGMSDLFHRGEFKNISSIDINSSYSHQMSKAPLPTGRVFM